MSQVNTPHNSTPQAGTTGDQSATNGSDAGVLSLIADLESRLTGLKQMHEMGTKRQVELAGRESDLLHREDQLRSGIESLARRQTEIEQLAAAVAQRQEQVQQSIGALDSRRQELERAVQHAESQRDEARKRTEAAAAAEASAAQRAREIEERESKFLEAQKQIESMRAEAARDSERARLELDALESALADRERLVAEAASKLEQHRAELVQGQEKLAEAQQRLADESARFRRETQQMEADARERADSLRELEDRLNERLAELKRDAEQVERERVMVTEQARTLTEQAGASDEHASAIHSGRAEQAQIQLGEANARCAGLQTELAQVKEDLANALEQLAQAQSALGQVQKFSPEELARRDRELAQLRDELEQLQGASATLQSRIEEGQAAAASMHGADEQEIAKRDQAILKLKDRLDSANRLIEQLKSASSGDGAADPIHTARQLARRDRLRKYKSLLQSQARKIIQAQSAIQKRHGECEQVFAQRTKLHAAWEEVQKREKRLAGAKARSGAAAVLACAVVTLGVLAGLSWAAAEKIWPGTYVARATLRADAHGRAAAPNELQAWQAYHEDLVKNPQLIEVAAERMSRRGLAKLGTVADLRTKLDAELFTQSSEAGALTIELREVGGERAKLVLDTYVTALKSVADSAREGRAEDLGTLIAEPAFVLAAPLGDRRLENAGMLLAGGCLAALLGGLLIWSRMTAAKRRFDESQAVEAALEQVDWATLESSMKKGAGTEGAPSRKSRKSRPA